MGKEAVGETPYVPQNGGARCTPHDTGHYLCPRGWGRGRGVVVNRCCRSFRSAFSRTSQYSGTSHQTLVCLEQRGIPNRKAIAAPHLCDFNGCFARQDRAGKFGIDGANQPIFLWLGSFNGADHGGQNQAAKRPSALLPTVRHLQSITPGTH